MAAAPGPARPAARCRQWLCWAGQLPWKRKLTRGWTPAADRDQSIEFEIKNNLKMPRRSHNLDSAASESPVYESGRSEVCILSQLASAKREMRLKGLSCNIDFIFSSDCLILGLCVSHCELIFGLSGNHHIVSKHGYDKLVSILNICKS